jgi:hypothetical protein
MKEAARVAEEAGTLGTLLHKLFQRTFAVAKEVRSTTAIGANIVSMAAAAVHLAERIFERIAVAAVLFIGAGEMIELCAAHFAGAAAEAHHGRQPHAGARQRRWPPLRATPCGSTRWRALPNYDIVVSCTASPLPIIGLGMVERALKARRHRPMVMVDLAVPRDIEPRSPARRRLPVHRRRSRRRSSIPVWSRGSRRWSRPRRSSPRGSTASCTGCRRARRCRPSARCAMHAERMRRHELERALRCWPGRGPAARARGAVARPHQQADARADRRAEPGRGRSAAPNWPSWSRALQPASRRLAAPAPAPPRRAARAVRSPA